MESISSQLFLCDDAAARFAAESLGFEVHGTIGVLVRSIRRGLRARDDVIAILSDLPQRSTLYVSAALLARVITQVRSIK
jgi:predicted nucleic acid-binding protein